MKSENIIIVLEGKKRSIISRIIASIIFAIPLLIVYKKGLFYNLNSVEEFLKLFLFFLFYFLISLPIGFFFSNVSSLEFIPNENKFREVISIGPFYIGSWETIADLKYTSVFLNNRNVYEVSVWLTDNNHYVLSTYKNSVDAEIKAKSLAEKFNIYFYEK